MADHGSLVTEGFMADATFKRFLSRMLSIMVGQMNSGLKGLITGRTGEISNIFMVRTHMGRQSTGLAKCLVAIFTSDLTSYSMSS